MPSSQAVPTGPEIPRSKASACSSAVNDPLTSASGARQRKVIPSGWPAGSEDMASVSSRVASPLSPRSIKVTASMPIAVG